MTIAEVFSSLTGRQHKRRHDAWTRVLAGADALAAGKSVDVGGLDEAIVEAGIDVEGLADIVERMRVRRSHLEKVSGLEESRGVAAKKRAALDQEQARFREAERAYRAKAAGLFDAVLDADRLVSAGERSVEWLLTIDNVSGPLRDQLQSARDQEQAAREKDGSARRAVREQEELIRDAKRSVAQWSTPDPEKPHAVGTSKGVSERSGADEQKLGEWKSRLAARERQLPELAAAAARAAEALVAAEAARVAVEKLILSGRLI